MTGVNYGLREYHKLLMAASSFVYMTASSVASAIILSGRHGDAQVLAVAAREGGGQGAVHGAGAPAPEPRAQPAKPRSAYSSCEVTRINNRLEK
eukprot:SAG25_NODE_303_length_10153_cov_13.304356_10_plen_94_part_00